VRGTGAFQGFGQQPQERSAQERSGGKTYEVRQEAAAGFRRQEEYGACDRGARDAAQGREGEDRG
jgi:hypothetical protein